MGRLPLVAGVAETIPLLGAAGYKLGADLRHQPHPRQGAQGVHAE